jgi:dCMP deaminase
MKKAPRPVPSWDEFYMGLVFWMASRSKDPNTQHGALIVDVNHRPLGFGYNGAPTKISDKDIDWRRPEKYPYIIHAEANAIDHSGGQYNSLSDCTIYITGMPCPPCMLRIIGKGMRRIVFGPQGSNMLDEAAVVLVRDLAKMSNMVLDEYVGSLSWMRDRMIWLENNLPGLF